MKKLLENQIFRNVLSTLSLGILYLLVSFLDKGSVEIGTVAKTMVFYFLILCLLYFIAPKLRKLTGHDKKNKR